MPDASAEAFDIEVRLNPTSADLAGLAVVTDEVPPLANDTSIAVVSLPRSPLGEAVYRVERTLTAAEVRARVPIVTDVKVMGIRTGKTIAVTVAAAVLAHHATGNGVRRPHLHADPRGARPGRSHTARLWASTSPSPALDGTKVPCQPTRPERYCN